MAVCVTLGHIFLQEEIIMLRSWLRKREKLVPGKNQQLCLEALFRDSSESYATASNFLYAALI